VFSSQEIDQVMGSTAYDSDGDEIGKVGQVYLDEQSNQPAWVTVNTGLFGTSESFAPVNSAAFSGDRLTLGYDKDKVKGAPNVAADGHLSHDEEQQLYSYYGMSYGSGYTTDTTDATTTGTTTDNVHGTLSHETTGRTTDDAITRSEEQVRVGVAKQKAGPARLRKYVESDGVDTAGGSAGKFGYSGAGGGGGGYDGPVGP
jgi:hypothetical protein